MTDTATTPPTVTLQPVDAPEIKPGMKTSEFIVTLVIIALGSVLASGLIVNNTALQLAGVVMATLKALAFTWSRTAIKTAAALVFLVAVAHTSSACSWFKSESKTVVSDVVDCTVSTATANIKQFGPALDALLVYATDGGGKLNTDAIKSASTGFAKEVGGCVVADAIARALKPAPADPNAPKSSPLVADPESLHWTLAALYPHVKFHTAAGDL